MTTATFKCLPYRRWACAGDQVGTGSSVQTEIVSNNPLLGSVVLTFALQMAVLYVPILQPVFKTEALDIDELLFSLALSSVVFFAVECEKWIYRRGKIYTVRKPNVIWPDETLSSQVSKPGNVSS